ncbi:hypothetical protein MCOR32_003782 [Pyricularia oryzae]|nr:hypothetical protein MCOR32_003782 [Pyricularia oryzae]
MQVTINRANSWSRIDTAWPMFKAICGELEPPESFLRIVGGMGRRLADTDRDAMITWLLSAISPDYCVRTTRQGNRRSYQLWYENISHSVIKPKQHVQ